MSTPDDTEKFKRFYDHISSKHDPHGFQLYFAAQEVTGIKHLWEEFPYEDACGRFELADGHQLLQYLTAAYFRAMSWEIVPGTTYERAILREVDTGTPEYRAFEEQVYEAALQRMGFAALLPLDHGTRQNTEIPQKRAHRDCGGENR